MSRRGNGDARYDNTDAALRTASTALGGLAALVRSRVGMIVQDSGSAGDAALDLRVFVERLGDLPAGYGVLTGRSFRR